MARKVNRTEYKISHQSAGKNSTSYKIYLPTQVVEDWGLTSKGSTVNVTYAKETGLLIIRKGSVGDDLER